MFISTNGPMTREKYDFIVNFLQKQITTVMRINNEINLMEQGLNISWYLRYVDPNRSPLKDIMKDAQRVFRYTLNEMKEYYTEFSEENDLVLESDKNLLETHSKNLLENEAAKKSLEYTKDLLK